MSYGDAVQKASPTPFKKALAEAMQHAPGGPVTKDQLETMLAQRLLWGIASANVAMSRQGDSFNLNRVVHSGVNSTEEREMVRTLLVAYGKQKHGEPEEFLKALPETTTFEGRTPMLADIDTFTRRRLQEEGDAAEQAHHEQQYRARVNYIKTELIQKLGVFDNWLSGDKAMLDPKVFQAFLENALFDAPALKQERQAFLDARKEELTKNPDPRAHLRVVGREPTPDTPLPKSDDLQRLDAFLSAIDKASQFVANNSRNGPGG